jgi:transcriptional regulator with XRE-family HTH domain
MIPGHLLKLLRTVRSIDQKTVSRHLGISQQAYSKIERSEYIDKTSLQKVMEVLKTTPEELEQLKSILSRPADIR